MKKIIIAEKPTLAKTVKDAIYDNFKTCDGYYESDTYIITWAFGHLYELWSVDDYLNREQTRWNLEELPIIPENFRYKVKNDAGVKKQLKVIKSLLGRKDVDTIINCGDADTEGEVIITNILNFCKKDMSKDMKLLRLWLPEQSPQSIRSALKNMKPNSDYIDIYNEGVVRACMDWLYGINYTRGVSVMCKTKLPIGRVLTPTVEFIYNRYKAQQNFKSEKFYTISAIINKDNQALKVSVKDVKFAANQQLNAQGLANNLNKLTTIVNSVESKEITKQPPKLFSMNTLQKVVSKKYKWSTGKIKDVLQKIYEAGYVTYPRTDSEYLSVEDKPRVEKILSELAKIGFNDLEMRNSTSIFNDSKITSHSAITPTPEKVCKSSELTGDEKTLYEVIRNRFMANFCQEKVVVNETTVIISSTNTPNDITVVGDYVIEIKGQAVVKEGFLKYEKVLNEKTIPLFKTGEKLIVKYSAEEGETQPPKNVTTSELFNYLMNPFKKDTDGEEEEYRNILLGLQIGTVATRADIIENAKKYEYIKENKSVLTIEPKGIYLMESLSQLRVDMSKEKTAQFGAYLKKVSKGQLANKQCIEVVAADIKKNISNIKASKVQEYVSNDTKEVVGICPKCGKNVYESKVSFYCDGYKDEPKCTFSLFKENKFFKMRGKTITKSVAKSFLKNGKATIKGLKRKDGKGTYDAIFKMIVAEPYVSFEQEGFVNSNKK